MPKAYDGSRYYVVFVDEASRHITAKALPSKHLFSTYKRYVTQLQHKTGRRVLCFHSDNGTEFKNKLFKCYNQEEGIEDIFSPPYTPQLNGIAERAIQWLNQAIKVVLKQAGMPFKYWPLLSDTLFGPGIELSISTIQTRLLSR